VWTFPSPSPQSYLAAISRPSLRGRQGRLELPDQNLQARDALRQIRELLIGGRHRWWLAGLTPMST
jgi:hypothetical protein